MAANEGIRFPFPTQPSARSPKLPIYESLFLLNQGVDEVIAILCSMEKFSFVDKESLHSAQAEIEEVRTGMNADFAERLVDRERHDEGRFWKQRRAFEKKWGDPDDVYVDVVRREEKRKKLGLPLRVVGSILPHSAVAQAEERWAAEQERKKKHARKRPSAKRRARERS